MQNFYRLAYSALMDKSADNKAACIGQMQTVLAGMAESAGVAADGTDLLADQPLTIDQPGQPEALSMVDPRALERRKLSTPAGRACFIHAIAHIEFNAINLALDAVYRFRGLPILFYRDWLQVAAEEAQHHQLLVARLKALGYGYGDFTVHNGLWDITRRTDHDLMSRMAIVPCVFEARGLDVTPPMIEKLKSIGDDESAAALQQILDEEVHHVAIGLRWYRYACKQRGLDVVDQFVTLVQMYLPGRRQGPFNVEKRKLAGFTDEWIARLQQLDQGRTRL